MEQKVANGQNKMFDFFWKFYKNAIKISKGIFKKIFFSLKRICHKTPIKCHNKNTHNIF